MDPAVITVTGTATAEVVATGATLHLEVAGQNYLYGNAALEGCAGVRSALQAIRAVEPGAQATVGSVSVKTGSGWLAKSSACDYVIAVKLPSLERIGHVLGVVMTLKSIELGHLEWEFDDEAVVLGLLADATRMAHRRAQAMAAALGVAVAGVHAGAESVNRTDPDGFRHTNDLSMRKSKMAAGPPEADFGSELAGRRSITANARMEFRLTDTPAPAA